MLALLLAANGNLPTLHRVALGAGLRLGEADAADAGFGVRAAGDAVAVDRLHRFARHVRDRHHAFHAGNMRQLRRAGHDVANGVDVGFAGLLVRVHFDEAAVKLDAQLVQADILGDRFAAHRDQ